MEAFNVLPDPQTNGGLLISVSPNAVEQIINLFGENDLKYFTEPIGRMISKKEKTILVVNSSHNS